MRAARGLVVAVVAAVVVVGVVLLLLLLLVLAAVAAAFSSLCPCPRPPLSLLLLPVASCLTILTVQYMQEDSA